MKTRLTSTALVGVFVTSLVLWLAAAQGLLAQKTQDDDHAAHHPPAQDTDDAADEEAQGKPMGKRMPMRMSPAMMMRCRAMMHMRVQPYDPAVVLALKDQLDLTERQVKRIEQVLSRAQDKTEDLLTEEQRKKLAPLAGKPETSMEMHRQMMQRMQKRMKGKGPMGCPMMEMMQQEHADHPTENEAEEF